MNRFGLTDVEQKLICDILHRHDEVTQAKIFGSRAKGNFQPNSDIDLALWGNISFATLAAIAGELDDLPLPYTFDIQAYDTIHHHPLREHIDRVAQNFYVCASKSVLTKA
jgi:predicted nucleotidyltransferase